MGPRTSCRSVVVCFVVAAGVSYWLVQQQAQSGPSEETSTPPAATYRSPFAVAVSPDSKRVYVSDRTARCVEILDPAGKQKQGEIPLEGQPLGMCLSPDGARLYVAERGASSVAVIDTAKSAVAGRIKTDRWPVAVALAPKSRRLFVANEDTNQVTVVDLSESPGKPIKQIPVVREPCALAVTPDERFVVVNNRVPLGVSTDPTLAAVVSIIDTSKLAQTATVKLPPGSSVVYGVCASPDGKWAYVVHGLGRFNLPMTQLERGWVNTFALSIIDIAEGTRFVTVLLDDLTQGAADPFAVVCSRDGHRLWISHAGIHEVSTVEIALLHELLGGNVPTELASLMDGSLPNIWVRIQKDRSLIAELANDLTALYIAGAIRRAPSGGNGPRGLALSPDEKTLFVANYFAGSVAALDPDTGKLQSTIALGPQAEPDAARRGEALFHDATHAFQRWHSCATCHPNDARMDGLRWDFADDGLGNAMNTLSLRFLDKTEPLHRMGTLKDLPFAAKHGLTFTHMLVPTEQEINDLIAYLKSLRPEPSPHLAADDQLTGAAGRGKVLFEGKADCAGCHSGPYYTDQKLYNVGIGPVTQPDARFKSTSLIEGYRTAPYMHDGRALTLKEVLTTFNPKDEHGKTKTLTPKEIEDLVAYLQSL